MSRVPWRKRPFQCQPDSIFRMLVKADGKMRKFREHVIKARNLELPEPAGGGLEVKD